MRHGESRPNPSGFDDRLLDDTISVFQPRTSRILTREDAREIAHNLTGVFGLLLEWKKARLARQSDSVSETRQQTEGQNS